MKYERGSDPCLSSSATLLQTYAMVGLRQVVQDMGIRKAREILQSKDTGWHTFKK